MLKTLDRLFGLEKTIKRDSTSLIKIDRCSIRLAPDPIYTEYFIVKTGFYVFEDKERIRGRLPQSESEFFVVVNSYLIRKAFCLKDVRFKPRRWYNFSPKIIGVLYHAGKEKEVWEG